MKIQSIQLSTMRNDEHFQFHTEFIELVKRAGAARLKVETLFEAYMSHYMRADEALKKIIKSALTAKLQQADKRRDVAFRGLVDKNRVGLKHFKAEVQEAAKNLKILFDTYGKLAPKPLNEQTSAVYNLMQELDGKYAAALQIVGLEEWAAELKAANNAFAELYRERLDESAQQTDAVLKQERKNMDTLYRKLTERLHALIIVEGEADFREFVRSLNTLVEKYKNTLARRTGRAKKEVYTEAPPAEPSSEDGE